MARFKVSLSLSTLSLTVVTSVIRPGGPLRSAARLPAHSAAQSPKRILAGLLPSLGPTPNR